MDLEPRRIGRFKVSDFIYWDLAAGKITPEIKALFKDMYPVRIDPKPHEIHFEFTAICKHFDLIKFKEEIPLYDIILTKDERTGLVLVDQYRRII